jgi:DNA anti-recombination protein RmuC
LIPAGGVFEIRQRFDLNKTASSRQVVIAAIVFEDGSFEGEPDDAAQMAADLTGLRTQISKTIQIFKNASTSLPQDSRAVFSRLKREIGALEEEADPSVVNELVTRFAKASEDMRNRRIKEIMQNSLQSVNRKSRRQIWDFERQLEQSSGSDLGQWISETIKELETMLGSN